MSDEKMAAGFEACRLLVLSLLNRKPLVSAHDVSELGNPFNGWRNANGGQVSTSRRVASSLDIAREEAARVGMRLKPEAETALVAAGGDQPPPLPLAVCPHCGYGDLAARVGSVACGYCGYTVSIG